MQIKMIWYESHVQYGILCPREDSARIRQSLIFAGVRGVAELLAQNVSLGPWSLER